MRLTPHTKGETTALLQGHPETPHFTHPIHHPHPLNKTSFPSSLSSSPGIERSSSPIVSSSPGKVNQENHHLNLTTQQFTPESALSHISRLQDEITEDEDSIQRFTLVLKNIDICSDPKKKKLLERNRPEYQGKVNKVEKRLEHKQIELSHWKSLLDEYNIEQGILQSEFQHNKEEVRKEKAKEVQMTMDSLDRAYRLHNEGLALRVENPNDPDRLEKLSYVHPNEEVDEVEKEGQKHKVGRASPVLSHKNTRKLKQKDKKMRKERATSDL
jgi:hypothetical protein